MFRTIKNKRMIINMSKTKTTTTRRGFEVINQCDIC